jgi:aminoglycoside 6-adenylyltransferase
VNYEQLEEKIRTWAVREQGVRALVVIGSRARSVRPADDLSDLDLILFVENQADFAHQSSWLDNFGQIWLKALQEAGDPEWFVLFDGGLKVDFLIAAAGDFLAEALRSPRFADVSRRGLRILVDKQEAGADNALAPPVEQGAPGAAEFEAAVHWFWICAHRAAVLVARGELWRARQVMDGDMRRQLQTMLAWHARAKSSAELDTWYDGRYLEEWVDPRALAELPEIFAAFDAASTARALGALLDLFAWTAWETAAHYSHPYPGPLIARTREWIEARLEDWPEAW